MALKPCGRGVGDRAGGGRVVREVLVEALMVDGDAEDPVVSSAAGGHGLPLVVCGEHVRFVLCPEGV